MGERTVTLRDDLRRLSAEMNLLKTHHESLTYICSKLSSVSNKNLTLDSPSLKNKKSVTFYESDSTLAINDPSFILYSASDDVISDIYEDSGPDLSNINFINGNCNEYLSKCFFAEENAQIVLPEEILETPFFNLKRKTSIYNDGIDAEDKMDPSVNIMLMAYVLERCDFYDDHRLYFPCHNVQYIISSPILNSINKLLTIWNFVIIFEPMSMMKDYPAKINVIKESLLKEEENHVEYLVNTGLIPYLSSGFIKKETVLVDIAESKYQWNDLYFLTKLSIKTCLGYLQRRIIKVIIISTINILFTPLQLLKVEFELLNKERYELLSELYTQLKFIISTSKSQKEDKLNIICMQRSLSPPNLVYTTDIYKQFRNEIFFINYGAEKGNLEMNGKFESLMSSTSLKPPLKERQLTSSLKLWNIINMKAFETICRRITSEMFKVKTYSESITSYKMSNNTVRNFKENLKEVTKTNSEDTCPSNSITEKSLSHSKEVIKLSSVELLEQGLQKLDFENPQIQQCKNIFDMKKAMKEKMFKNSKESLNMKLIPSYFSVDKIKAMMTNNQDSFERIDSVVSTVDLSSVSTIKNNKEKINDTTTFNEMTYFGDIYKDYCNNKNIKIKKGFLSKVTEENSMNSVKEIRKFCNINRPYPTTKLKVLQRTETELTGNESLRSNRLLFSGDQNRYFKTSKRFHAEELMGDVNIKEEKFKTKTLRQKAAACILSSKVNVSDRQRTHKTSSHIDKYFDSENKILNKTYRCLECRTTFKLGTELRQHLRSHVCPQLPN